MTIVAPAGATVRVRAFDHDITPFSIGERHWRALIGIDLATKPGTYRIRVDADGRRENGVYRLVVKPRRFRTRHLTVNPDFVTPPASARERINRESALLNEVFRDSSSTRLWESAFMRPVPDPANSAFGTRSIFNGTPRNQHTGADFMSLAGAPIHAPNAGRIVVARDLYFSGNTVVIDHGLGLFSTLAHLSAFAVKEGDRVTAGQVVGEVGATGRVTGPHLHWIAKYGNLSVNPLSLLSITAQPKKPVAPRPRPARPPTTPATTSSP